MYTKYKNRKNTGTGSGVMQISRFEHSPFASGIITDVIIRSYVPNVQPNLMDNTLRVSY